MVRTSLACVSVAALAACAGLEPAPPVDTASVPAALETAPMTGEGDRADDPAIWIHPTDSARSLILGTNKDEGLYVYDLSGAQLQILPVGRINNVDVYGPIAAASNDEVEAISWFGIDPETGEVSHIADTPVGKVEPYGFCLGRVGGALIAGVTYKDGTVQIWAPVMDAGRLSGARLERTVQLASQLEGCAFDAAQSLVFIGEEAEGIWSLDLSDAVSTPQSVDRIADGNGLAEDVEGLSIWEGEEDGGYLVASAQGADRFVVYDRAPPHAPRGVFTVAGNAGAGVDAVSHTDGLDVVSDALPGFPRGLLVVQDDANPVSEVDQNFKLVDWRDVEAALGLAESP